ncbi:phosphoglucomutase [Treponema zuelzerae]|uniref:Phosphoglucomutase n=1 Tax=Teretinema zuelzerae TaxID=156 RepID=A0AAE3JH66_9SPIR|nr:phosphoglucomutase [Teretinema zuelzerae]MCD1653307.1 phosphoglucomutase [Teretinema zuelzerae]
MPHANIAFSEFADSHDSLLSSPLPSYDDVQNAFSPLILSASGWRKPFAESGADEDPSPTIGKANTVLAVHMAAAFAEYLHAKTPHRKPRIVVALDSRPTGIQLADAMCRAFIASDIEVHFPSIAAAPEAMAYARSFDGFAYISASHNPIAHNGVKFGLDDGGVLPGQEVAILIKRFTEACRDPGTVDKANTLLSACPRDALAAVRKESEAEKKACLEAYERFARTVISGRDEEELIQPFFELIRSSARKLKESGTPLSVVADFNGSARASSIDKSFMESCGIGFFSINSETGKIAHRIVPEGESLSYCAEELKRLRTAGSTAEERNTVLGYMPDCDGDRGNIVFWNEETGEAEILQAQEVFALSVVAELSHLFHQKIIARVPGSPCEPPAAVVVNDPTSLMIESIAEKFGVSVARAEVGEANVVNLAREYRSKGYIVRILGEGSNGGNITHPAAVRDPLNTLFALLKMLIIRDDADGPGLYHLWCAASGQEHLYRENFTLNDIRKSLPSWVTTSVFEADAMLRITTLDHGELKRKFQNVFLREWKAKKDSLAAEFEFADWTAISNNGVTETRGIGDFGESGKGGLKIQFLDRQENPAGYLWMRGSGTEPVFRILADCRGTDVSKERRLLEWLTAMVLEADREIV